MYEIKKNKFFNYILTFMIVILLGCFFANPIKASAEESVVLGKYTLDDHAGMSIQIKGKPAFCIQRGVPFRSAVSEIQMTRTNYNGQSITMAQWIRWNLDKYENDNAQEHYKFVGWGTWGIDNTHSVITQTSTTGAPSSAKILDEFDKETIDDEDDFVSSKNRTSYTDFYYTTVYGHEGSTNVYSTKVKNVSYANLGLDERDLMALSLINYYIYKDPDASGFSDTAKRQVAQTLVWAVEFDFITTTGTSGNSGNRQMIFQNSNGKYKYNGKVGWSGNISCDEYVKKYIGKQYNAMKLYRQFVWKMNNLRTIPSFAYDTVKKAYNNPIHLKWDSSEQAYVATVADANGVLKYFDFNIDGVTCTENSDGTLTIKSKNKISGTKTNYKNGSGATSTLLPSDCKFSLPISYRWTLEGTSDTFTYTVAKLETLGWGTLTTGGQGFRPKHDHSWKCQWFCGMAATNTDDYCTKTNNAHKHTSSCYRCSSKSETGCKVTLVNGKIKHSVSNCGGKAKTSNCKNTPNIHEHTTTCYHYAHCPSYNKTQTAGTTTKQPLTSCVVNFTCTKMHYTLSTRTVSVKFVDWQDDVSFALSGKYESVDPREAFVAIVTDDSTYKAETDVDIKLIDQNGNEVDHIKVGEKYKLRYIYTYTGDSKGFKISNTTANKTYYRFTYLARMKSPNNTKKLIDIKNDTSVGTTFSKEKLNVYSLAIDKTNVTISGTYVTSETPYPGTNYNFKSNNAWNDSIYLDALTTNVSGYTYKTATQIQNSSLHKNNVKVSKANNKITVTWTYDTDYEVFTSPVVNATAYINVGGNQNKVATNLGEKYSYASGADDNYVGGNGYFGYSTIATPNSEYQTYAIKNTVWQSDVEITTSNLKLNTGAGITEHIYSVPNAKYHNVNYNLYYTIKVSNPKAHISSNKIRQYNGLYRYKESDTTPMTANEIKTKYNLSSVPSASNLYATEEKDSSKTINTSSDVYEFDLNTLISWGASGSTLTAVNGSTVVVDHVKTGTTYLQRTIPTNLTVLKSGTATMTTKVYPNYDRLIYEDTFNGVTKESSKLSRRYKLTLTTKHYTGNELSVSSTIYPAMNPNVAKPTSIQNTNTYGKTSSFYITLSNGVKTKIYDRLTKSYTQYDFTFNTSKADNKVTFGNKRTSAKFYKYSNTTYTYNNKTVNKATGTFSNKSKTQTEKYYISQVLFKSNYTTKHQAELEKQGANYIVESKSNGEKDVWIDMVNQNNYAIVAAGQGFELKVTVKYENSFLTQYLARYYNSDDAQKANKGSSSYKTPQYCNISPMTGGYLSGFNTLDKLAVNLVTGSNVYKDLYAYMSDNPDTVYSYSGMYDTPIIFDRKVSYSSDYSVTTITYTMKQSTENGVSSSYQNMKFYTNQLASDSETPGIVTGGNLQKGKHSITLWTPIVAATPFDYPNAMQDRYIGDAIELGYTIKSTGADDSIVHIVQ